MAKRYTYKELVDLGFKRYDMEDGEDLNGFEDFYLFLKISSSISFEWHWEQPEVVKMVRYKEENILHTLTIHEKRTLTTLINFFKKTNNTDMPLDYINEHVPKADQVWC